MLDRYDDNNDDVIDTAELFKAIDDYFDYLITIAEVFAVIDLYFSVNT